MTKTTPVPNLVFDSHLRNLKIAELKILLVITRQTLGWKKSYDWISNKQLQQKSGISKRGIVSAIQSLIKKKLIEVLNANFYPLPTPAERKGKKQLLYCLAPSLLGSVDNEGEKRAQGADNAPTNAKNITDIRKGLQELVQQFALNK